MWGSRGGSLPHLRPGTYSYLYSPDAATVLPDAALDLRRRTVWNGPRGWVAAGPSAQGRLDRVRQPGSGPRLRPAAGGASCRALPGDDPEASADVHLRPAGAPHARLADAHLGDPPRLRA